MLYTCEPINSYKGLSVNLKIEVKTIECAPKSGVGKKSGRAYSFKEQPAYAHIAGKPYPVEMSLTLDDVAQPYPPGMYTLADDSFYVGDFKKLECKPRLVPLAGK